MTINIVANESAQSTFLRTSSSNFLQDIEKFIIFNCLPRFATNKSLAVQFFLDKGKIWEYIPKKDEFF